MSGILTAATLGSRLCVADGVGLAVSSLLDRFAAVETPLDRHREGTDRGYGDRQNAHNGNAASRRPLTSAFSGTMAILSAPMAAATRDVAPTSAAVRGSSAHRGSTSTEGWSTPTGVDGQLPLAIPKFPAAHTDADMADHPGTIDIASSLINDG